MEKVVEIMRVDVPNKNNRLYTRESIENAIDKANFPISGTIGMKDKFGALETSHVVQQIWIEPDGKVMAHIKVMRTPLGKAMEQLLEDDPDNLFCFRTSGAADLVDGQITNYRIDAVNLVLDGA